jgi:hypothetical protein
MWRAQEPRRRRLRPDIVDAQRRQQADDGGRDRGGDHGDGLKFVRLGRGQAVEARADLLDCPLRNEPLEFGERDPKRLDVAGAEKGPEAGFPQASRGEGLGWHLGNIINVGTYMQVPTFIQRRFPVLFAGNPGPCDLRKHPHDVAFGIANLGLDFFKRTRRLVAVEIAVEIDLVADQPDLLVLRIPLFRIGQASGTCGFTSRAKKFSTLSASGTLS